MNELVPEYTNLVRSIHQHSVEIRLKLNNFVCRVYP